MKSNCKIIISLICLITSLSCSNEVMASQPDDLNTLYKDEIMNIKEDMLAAADTANHFWFSDDIEFQNADPHAYWLMNRMMHTVQYVQTAEDGVAWALALNENVQEYSRRIERRIYDDDAEDAAILAIEHLINLYGAGNQPEINTKSYVVCTLELYRTINRYIRLLKIHMEKPLGQMLYREYREWFDLTNAANAIMTFYTYGAAHYSALPMDINYTFASWSQERLKELDVEKEIFRAYRWERYESQSKRISERRYDKLIEYFRQTTKESIVEEIVSDWVEKDYEFAQEIAGNHFDLETVSLMAGLYQSALYKWRMVREEISVSLPKEKQDSYRAITKQMHNRLYHDLLELKDIKY